MYNEYKLTCFSASALSASFELVAATQPVHSLHPLVSAENQRDPSWRLASACSLTFHVIDLHVRHLSIDLVAL